MSIAEIIERPPKDTFLSYQRFTHLDSSTLIRYNYNKKIEKVLRKNQVLELQFHQITTNLNDYIIQLISTSKRILGFAQSSESIFIIGTELIQNAVKANFKRIYFKQKHINPLNLDEYAQGLKDFKKILCKNTAHLAHLAWLLNYHVIFRIHKTNKTHISFDIINNVPLYEIERERISLKRETAEKYKSISEFYDVAGDETEGAGLGMMVIRMVIKEMSLSPKILKIYEDKDKNTIARLTLPLL